MVVNDKVRIAKNFQRWSMNYSNLEQFTSPTSRPDPFSNTSSEWSVNPKANGVYLHWTLPEAMRRGTQESGDARTDFPLVPNRWLVVRYSGPQNARVAKAWVVESDYVDPKDGTVPYLDRYDDKIRRTLIGRKLPLHEWQEKSETKSLFLTAIGPGDITFASYQPYVENVFSIHDQLTDVAAQDTLSYLVIGWYSDVRKDILANREEKISFADLMARLQWQVTDEKQTADTSVCHGLVYGIVWDNRDGCKEPASSMPDPENVEMAVGNTSIDALTALIHRKQGKGGDIDVQLLEAFQYGLLNKLNEPNGDKLLYQAIHRAWFGSYEGGYKWVIVKKQDTSRDSPYPNQGIDWNDSELNPDWLATLNRNQQRYDCAVRELRTSRWKLYAMWLAQGRFNHFPVDLKKNQEILRNLDPRFTEENFAAQLNPEKSGSLAKQVKDKIEILAGLQAKIPYGTTQENLEQIIAKFAVRNNLPDGYELKRTARENFYEANNPVVLLAGMAGTKTPLTLARDKALKCRFADSLISGFKINDKEITAASITDTIPSPDMKDLEKIRVAVRGLIDEFFFLDPNNATIIAEKVLNKTDPNTVTQAMAKHEKDIGQLPDMVLDTWGGQPWLPLYLLWQVEYYPIAHDSNGVENWTFDGIKYYWNGKGAKTENIILQGTTFMTPQSGFNFRKRLEDYLQKQPDLGSDALAKLESFIKQTDTWDLLSQTLEGFMDQLALRDVQSHVIPSDKTLADLIGEGNSIAPDLGARQQFQAYRSGQFIFRRLNVVDRFGRSLEVVNTDTYGYFKLVIAPEMTPTRTVIEQDPYRFIELRPRLLQPARLAFDFISNTDDSKSINLHSNTNPVCGWILPNHLDKALSCYDPSGNFLGELCVFTTAGNQKEVKWFPAPNTNKNDLDSITESFPHLGKMLNYLIKNKNGPQAFDNLLQTIDETLYVIDPLGSREDQNLPALIGRPLALVRSRLQFQLDGAALTDPSWKYVFQSKTSELANYAFPIRLGELELRNDGLIGYYIGDSYSQFNTVHMLKDSSTTPYIKRIEPGNFINLKFEDCMKFEESNAAYISMLLDPRAAVHATTDILPTLALKLPTRFIDPALANMAVTFRVGPLLSDTNIVKADIGGGAKNDETSLVMPIPARQNGKWSWLSVSGESMPVEDADANVHFSNISSELRTGYLQLVNALNTSPVANSKKES